MQTLGQNDSTAAPACWSSANKFGRGFPRWSSHAVTAFAVAILSPAALAKTHSLASDSVGLALKDPVMGISMPVFLISAITFDASVLVFITLAGRSMLRHHILRGAFLVLLLYRGGLMLTSAEHCPCLGLLITGAWPKALTASLLSVFVCNELVIWKARSPVIPTNT
jgi:hypothetical protein